jgi:hypothetical protein
MVMTTFSPATRRKALSLSPIAYLNPTIVVDEVAQPSLISVLSCLALAAGEQAYDVDEVARLAAKAILARIDGVVWSVWDLPGGGEGGEGRPEGHLALHDSIGSSAGVRADAEREERERRRQEELFLAMDADGDGGVDAGEFRAALRQLGVAADPAAADALLAAADADGSGAIDRAEFARLVAAMRADAARRAAERAVAGTGGGGAASAAAAATDNGPAGVGSAGPDRATYEVVSPLPSPPGHG